LATKRKPSITFDENNLNHDNINPTGTRLDVMFDALRSHPRFDVPAQMPQ
jgi:hypothetical protein